MVKWEGRGSALSGTIKTRGDGSGDLFVELADGSRCVGNFEQADGKGTWILACPGGLTADGNFRGHGKNKGATGTGRDNRGKNVRFVISGAAAN